MSIQFGAPGLGSAGAGGEIPGPPGWGGAGQEGPGERPAALGRSPALGARFGDRALGQDGRAPRARPPSPGGISSADAPDLDLPARFMALGMLGLATVGVLAPFALPLLRGSFYDPRLVAFVHLNTLGVIAAVVIGASYQLVPVVLQSPLASVRLGRLSFWCYVAGLVSFLVGFVVPWMPAVAAGGMLLVAAFGLYVGIVGVTLLRAPERDVIAAHVGVGLLSVALAVTLALLIAVNKATGFLGGLTLRAMAAHAALMLGGWVAVTLAGVAYRLVGMFTLAEERLHRPAAWLGLGLTTGGAWLLAGSLMFVWEPAVSLAGALGILAGVGIFAGQLARMYRGRRRKAFDVHIPFAATSALLGVAAAALLVLGYVRGDRPASAIWVAVGWLAIAGLAEMAIQGFFYKIATFLVFLHRYAPVAGRQRVPRLEDMYDARLAVAGWALWSLGIVGSLAAIPVGSSAVSHVAGVVLAAGLACFLANVLRVASHYRAGGR